VLLRRNRLTDIIEDIVRMSGCPFWPIEAFAKNKRGEHHFELFDANVLVKIPKLYGVDAAHVSEYMEQMKGQVAKLEEIHWELTLS